MNEGKTLRAEPDIQQATNTYAARQNGPTALAEQIKRLRAQADALEALLNALPRTLPREADEGLWELAMRVR